MSSAYPEPDMPWDSLAALQAGILLKKLPHILLFYPYSWAPPRVPPTLAGWVGVGRTPPQVSKSILSVQSSEISCPSTPRGFSWSRIKKEGMKNPSYFGLKNVMEPLSPWKFTVDKKSREKFDLS